MKLTANCIASDTLAMYTKYGVRDGAHENGHCESRVPIGVLAMEKPRTANVVGITSIHATRLSVMNLGKHSTCFKNIARA